MKTISLVPDLFKVKALLLDPAFYTALIPILTALIPGAAGWWSHHEVLIAPVLVVLAGHYGVRIGGVVAAGLNAAHATPEHTIIPVVTHKDTPAQAASVVTPIEPIIAASVVDAPIEPPVVDAVPAAPEPTDIPADNPVVS